MADTPYSLPPIPDDFTPEMGFRMWRDVMNASEQFLLAGLRREIGPDGDLKTAYRKWYKGQMEEHDKMIYHLMEELSKREEKRGG
jgi:hypothetical protein